MSAGRPPGRADMDAISVSYQLPAAAELRSVDGQIEYLIREALSERGRTPGGPEVEKADAMHGRRERSETQRGG